MQTNHISFTIILFTFLLLSCSDRQTLTSLHYLKRAEVLMDEQPENALSLLEDSIQQNTLHGKTLADWRLLVTYARDKNYIPHTSDSLIRQAVDYYEQHSDSERLMLAYYVIGRVYHDIDSLPKAQHYFLKALTVDEKHTAKEKLSTRINYNLGILYLFQEMPNSAFRYLKKTEEHFRRAGDTTGLFFSLREIARAYDALGHKDSSALSYREVLLYTDIEERPFMLNELAWEYLGMEQLDSAYKYAYEAMQFYNEDDNFSALNYVMGNIYMKTENLDSAKHYLHKVINSPASGLLTRSGAYKKLHIIAKNEKLYEESIFYLDKYELLEDSLKKQTYTQTLLEAEILYQHEEAEKKAPKDDYIILHIMAIFATATIGVNFIFAYLDIIRKESGCRSFKTAEKKNNEEERRIREEELQLKIQEETFKAQTLANKNIREETFACLQNESIYKKFHSPTTKRFSEKDYNELYEAISKFYPNFYTYLKKRKLTFENIQTASLLKIQLDAIGINKLFNNRSTVTARLNSLSEKLLEQTCETKAERIKRLTDFLADI